MSNFRHISKNDENTLTARRLQRGLHSLRPAIFVEAGSCLFSAAVLLFCGYVFLFQTIHPEFAPFMESKAKKLTVPSSNFLVVSAGATSQSPDHLLIEDFNGDEAILALPRSFRAEDFPFIKVNLKGITTYTKAKMLWQQEGHNEIHSLALNREGDGLAQVAMVRAGELYAGRISSLALLLYDGPELAVTNNKDVDIALNSLELRPFSVSSVTEQLVSDWSNPQLWRGHSPNLVIGAHPDSLIRPNLAFCSLLLLSVFLVLLKGLFKITVVNGTAPNSKHLLMTLAVICLMIWAMQDGARWVWRLHQLADSVERYAHTSLREKGRANVLRCARDEAGCYERLAPYF